jgi:hypothetical protein
LIGRDLTLIDWDDIQALIASGRREDDLLELKQSFKGSDDLAALNDRQRDQAIDSVAKEAVAFLNTRGGDIVLGVEEGANGEAVAIPGVARPAESAERLSRALAAVIEPAQTNIAWHAVADPADNTRGVIVFRVRPSLRAPHRSKRARECFARRGTESVPMAMDEIQDLTLYRSAMRQERETLLSRQFADFAEGMVEHITLPPRIFQIRLVALPFVEQEIEVDALLPSLMVEGSPFFYSSGKESSNNVAFRSIESSWRPILRGKKQESIVTTPNEGRNDVQLSARRIKSSGVMQFDFAILWHHDGKARVHEEWLIGFFADCLAAISAVAEQRPELLPATVRVGVRTAKECDIVSGSKMFERVRPFPSQTTYLPDALVHHETDLDQLFVQLQVDTASLAGVAPGSIAFRKPPSAG